MGKNYKVVAKRRRRVEYLKRKKAEASAKLQTAKPRKAPSKKAEKAAAEADAA